MNIMDYSNMVSIPIRYRCTHVLAVVYRRPSALGGRLIQIVATRESEA